MNLTLFAVGLSLGAWGKIRAYWRAEQYRGKVSGPIFGLLSIAFFGFFLFYVFHLSYQLPTPSRAPAVGQMAPDFTLPDQNGNPVTLSKLYGPALKEDGENESPEAETGNWVLLVFYRGYW